MASKYYEQAVALLVSCKVAEDDAKRVSRLASSEAANMGVGDADLKDYKATASATQFALYVKQVQKVKLSAKGKLTAAQTALRFVSDVYEFHAKWGEVAVTVPESVLTEAKAREAKEAEAKAKAEAEAKAKAGAK